MGITILLLIIFSIFFVFIWIWFFRNDKAIYDNFYHLGNQEFINKNFRKAKEWFLQILDLNDYPDATFKLGISHMKLSEYEEAKKRLEQYLKQNAKDFDAMLNLAQVLHDMDDLDGSLSMYNKALLENGQSLDCLLAIAQIYYEQGDYKKALETLERAKEIAPDNVQVAFSVTKCKNELCDLDNDDECQHIIDEYKKLEGSPNLPQDYDISLAKMYAKSGQIKKALEHCRNALEVNEQDVEAYKLLGLIQLINKNYKEAKNSLAIALSFQPNNIETHNIFSYILCQQDDDCSRKKCRDKYYELIEKHLRS